MPECRAFTLKHDGIANRIITEVHISVAFDPKNQPANVQLFKTLALWDTGATASIITDATAQSLSLQPTGKRMVQHGGGLSEHNTHVLNFYMPNQVAIAGIIATEHPANDGRFGAIIGMDIIMGGDMSLTNHNGETWFTFRWPSYGATDYVAEFDGLKQKVNFKSIPKPLVTPAQTASLPKVGRNEMCPCGSRRKYKKCHGSLI